MNEHLSLRLFSKCHMAQLRGRRLSRGALSICSNPFKQDHQGERSYDNIWELNSYGFSAALTGLEKFSHAVASVHRCRFPPPPHVAVVQSTGETPHFTELVPAVCTVLVPLMAEDWTTDMLCDSLEPCKGLCLRIFKHFEIYCLQWNLYLH